MPIPRGPIHKMKEDSSPQIKVISEHFVRPKYEVEASNQPYYLNPIDLAFLSLDQMQKGLLFPTKPNDVKIDLVQKLKDSVALVLVHYYPLAGRFAMEIFDDEHAMLVYVNCEKGDGARLVHAAVDVTVSDIISSVDVPDIVRSFFDLGERAVNYDGLMRPLLSIQVTELVDGVFIGFTINHSVADGTHLWSFISTVSETFLQLEKGGQGNENSVISISKKPIYKPFISDGHGPIFKLPYHDPNEFVVRFDPGRLRERIFRFSSESMSLLKTKAKDENNKKENELVSSGDNKISSFQALAGLLWRSITRSRKLLPDQETSCSFAIGSRTRLDPPVSEDVFGNYITSAQGTCKVGQILGHSFGWAALLIHKTLVAQDEKVTREFMGKFAKSPIVAHTGSSVAGYESNSVLIAGSARFDMYGPEFGLGGAVAVLAGYANKADGKVTANPGREGKGSVDLEVCLKPEVMGALELDEEFMSFVTK